MDDNLQEKNDLSFEDSFEIENININEFNSKEEECEYYKKEYYNYKLKYEYINTDYKKLINERNKLLFKIGILKNELNEKKYKNDKRIIQNDINSINLSDNNGKNNNFINQNDKDDDFDLEKEIKILNKNSYHKDDELNESIFETLKEETKKENKVLNELNNEIKINIQELNDTTTSTFDAKKLKQEEENGNNDDIKNIKIKNNKKKKEKKSFNKENSEHKIILPKRTFNKDSKMKKILEQKNIIINSILNSNTNNDSNNSENKNSSDINSNLIFDEDIIKKSLLTEFILYEKDSIGFRKLVSTKEQKINIIHILIKKWIHASKILKRGIELFNKAIEFFSKNLLNIENTEVFVESPDLLGLIYLLQKKLTDIMEQCSSFMGTIDSLFIMQLSNYKNKYLHNIKIQRYNLALKISELIDIQNQFLSLKINNSNNYKTMKDDYYSKYNNVELNKYEYLSNLNKILMMMQIEFPQTICLLSFSFLAFCKQIHESLKEIEGPIKDNLEKINVKEEIKKKIINNMNKEKKDLELKINKTINKNLLTKEGFLNIRENENNSHFKRNYFKIYEGKLIYYKIKKNNINSKKEGFDSKLYLNMIEVIDINEYNDLCNLLLSTVKKLDKKYEYPFCFEIIDASTKKKLYIASRY